MVLFRFDSSWSVSVQLECFRIAYTNIGTSIADSDGPLFKARSIHRISLTSESDFPFRCDEY